MGSAADIRGHHMAQGKVLFSSVQHAEVEGVMRNWTAIVAMLLTSASPALVCAQERPSETASSDRSWTRIGLYGFFVSIEGDVRYAGIEADVDVSFSDILDNLDAGFMGIAEHRRGRWSFFIDLAYLDLSESGGASVRGPLGMAQGTVTADVKFQEVLLEGFVGYRVLDNDLEVGRFGVDALVGARYNWLNAELGDEVSVFGLTENSDRERDQQWADGVFGIRAEYRADANWSLSGWADYGIGTDSHSYHLTAFVNYQFDNGVELSGGYRHYHMQYEKGSGSSKVELDLDYTGPMVGLTYTF